MMLLEDCIGLDAYYAVWRRIVFHLGAEHYARVRPVNRTSRRAVDDAVIAITVSGYTEGMLLPRALRFPACKQYAFINAPEGLPQYVLQYCRAPPKKKGVLVCGEACWKAPSLQEWLELYRSGMTWFGLVLRLCEEHQDKDLSIYLQGVLAAGSRVPLSLLGLWCGREQNVVLGSDICWAHPVAGIQGIEHFYAEFVHIDIAVLKGCTALRHLHLVFDEWNFQNVACISEMETLHVLCLESDSVANMDHQVLYELGQHVRILRLLGGAAARSFVEVLDWMDFLTVLFNSMSGLRLFETNQDASRLVDAARLQSQQGALGEVCDGLVIWPVGHLFIVADRQLLELRGILRTREGLGLLHDSSLK